MSFTDQSAFDVRCEWGPQGVAALDGCRTFIVVDVLSFSTCVSVAVSRGAEIIPSRAKDADAGLLAEGLGAALAGPRGSKYSLSPGSLKNVPRGLALVLPSPNGATISLEAALRGYVLAGCLRNRSAVAQRAMMLGGPFGVIAAGERWPDGSLRPALEDLWGAGAIVSALPGRRSPEAVAAAAAFEATRGSLGETLMACSSGRELCQRGYPDDVYLAAELDADANPAEFIDDRFRPGVHE